jgi:uncharacterized protein YcnI
MRASSWAKRALVGTAGVVALVGLAAGPASAHVTIGDAERPADAYTVLTVSVPHGCDGSAVTQVKIQIPESIPQVTPTINPGWDVAKVMVPLDEPIEGGHGAVLTERVGEVVYTAKTPLPDGYRDAFELSLRTPDLAGETLYFPTVQVCEVGEVAWVHTPPAGDPDAELDEPSPKITLVAAPASDATAPESSSSSDALAIVALVVGAVGIALGGVALLTRRRPA